jgi:hypothetical protein
MTFSKSTDSLSKSKSTSALDEALSLGPNSNPLRSTLAFSTEISKPTEPRPKTPPAPRKTSFFALFNIKVVKVPSLSLLPVNLRESPLYGSLALLQPPDSTVTSGSSSNQCLCIFNELVTTEKSFLEDLTSLITVTFFYKNSNLKGFKIPLTQDYSHIFQNPQQEIPEIFSNIEEIITVHSQIWNSMNKKLVKEVQAQLSSPLHRTFDVDGCCRRLANIFMNHSESLRVYVQYTGNYNVAVNRLSLLQKSHHYIDFISVKIKKKFHVEFQV